jgi:ketosteroid isomerase-like protein
MMGRLGPYPVEFPVKYALWMLLLYPMAYASPCPTGQTKDEAALVQVEQTWAGALEQRDTATLGCILADEFEDADVEGKLADRAATLAKAGSHAAVHHELSDLSARVHGDFAYIRGLATATYPQTKMQIKVRFTDIYVYREGRWQCVAGQESLVYAMSH